MRIYTQQLRNKSMFQNGQYHISKQTPPTDGQSTPQILFTAPALSPAQPPPSVRSRCLARLKEKGKYMGDTIIGQLKVCVVEGSNLVIRDFRSSDPYVVVKLGNQTKKTKIIDSCLDPVWNEEFTFTLTEPIQDLRLDVFDYDTFKYDDKMGNSVVSLQPIIAASGLRRALRLSTGEIKLRKVMPEVDNCLMRESYVSFVNGEIMQDVLLRLRDVESGELKVTLKLIEPN